MKNIMIFCAYFYAAAISIMVLDDITQQKEYIFAVLRLRLLIFRAETCRLVSGGECLSTTTVRIPEDKEGRAENCCRHRKTGHQRNPHRTC